MPRRYARYASVSAVSRASTTWRSRASRTICSAAAIRYAMSACTPKQIRQRCIVLLRPDRRIVGDANQLRRDPDLRPGHRARPADRSLDEVIDPEIRADPRNTLAAAVVAGERRAGRHRQPVERRQTTGDLLGPA